MLVHNQCRRPQQQRGSQYRECLPLWHDCGVSVVNSIDSDCSKQYVKTRTCALDEAPYRLKDQQTHCPGSENTEAKRKDKQQQQDLD